MPRYQNTDKETRCLLIPGGKLVQFEAEESKHLPEDLDLSLVGWLRREEPRKARKEPAAPPPPPPSPPPPEDDASDEDDESETEDETEDTDDGGEHEW